MFELARTLCVKMPQAGNFVTPVVILSHLTGNCWVLLLAGLSVMNQLHWRRHYTVSVFSWLTVKAPGVGIFLIVIILVLSFLTPSICLWATATLLQYFLLGSTCHVCHQSKKNQSYERRPPAIPKMTDTGTVKEHVFASFWLAGIPTEMHFELLQSSA